MGGLSVSKKLNLLEMEQQTFVEKHQKIEVLHELNETKIENLELHFKLMTFEEKSLFEKLDSVTTCLKEWSCSSGPPLPTPNHISNNFFW